jgi:nitroimidazol reductase NimA-like FMN-containing flavoprotein (pyridoxamine 5'-phosphate oxidase superfamily)
LAIRPTAEELARLERFLEPSMIAVVATVGRTGMPQLTPNWYRFANGRLTMSTTKERVKYLNLSRDPKMAVCIY